MNDQTETEEDRDRRIDEYNRRTQKLIPNGDATRDKLIAARLSLRRTT